MSNFSTTSGAVTSVIPGTGATNLGKAEDAPHTSGDVGVMMLAVRNDAGTALAGAGDYIPLSVDSTGRLFIAGSVAEDSAASSGGFGLVALGVRNDANATLTSANFDYSWICVDASGRTKTVDAISVQDQLDTPLLETGTSAIIGSGGALFQVVANLASTINTVFCSNGTTGFIGVYSGATTLQFMMPPSFNGYIHQNLGLSSTIWLRSMHSVSLFVGTVTMQFSG